MNCCQTQGIESVFNEELVTRQLDQYHKNGPDKTTRLLIEQIKAAGVRGLTLLDIGGGVGAIQHHLIEAGVQQATDVDASASYLQAAMREAARRGVAGQVAFKHGNFVELAQDVAPADIVTLDRVICCYPDMPGMVSLSTSRARKLYGLVYPRDAWWIKMGMAFFNFIERLRGEAFRVFVHPTREVDAMIQRSGFKQRFYYRTLLWQVFVYSRE